MIPCPACRTVFEEGVEICPNCQREWGWLGQFPEFRAALAAGRSSDAAELSPPRIARVYPRNIALALPGAVTLGRRVSQSASVIELPDEAVAPTHAVIAHEPSSKRYWLADAGTREGTFVNRKRVASGQLCGGDLLQIGGYAWTFSASDGFLIPATRIDGLAIEARIEDNRGRSSLARFPAGELIAITGKSGAGKSTLLMALVGASGRKSVREILVNGQEFAPRRNWFRRQLGYVSQQNTLLGDLSARQATRFAAESRGLRVDEAEIEQVLREVDLPTDAWERMSRDLSGGELKRTSVAYELIARPRLLILDEPTSGLDREREASLLRLLRNLSDRGLTVIVVTHHLRTLDQFDRVIVLDSRQVKFSGSPPELRSLVAIDDWEDLDFSRLATAPAVDETPNAANSPSEAPTDEPHVRERKRGVSARTWVLARRELTRIANAPTKRLLLPLTVMPAFFALALGIAVPAQDRNLLAFLSVLAAIWMGASLSLMAIVDEREAFEHERLLGLPIVPYLAAKTLVLCLLAAIQVCLFLALLAGTRSWGVGWEMLHGPGRIAIVLVFVSWASTAMGLLISALAGTHRPKANFILPLVMIAQIVFGSQVAGRGEAPLHIAYGEFNAHFCQGARDCQRRAQSWRPDLGGWLCDDCRDSYPEFERVIDRVADRQQDRERPSLAASCASYLTISRYGDIVLRSFATSQDDFDALSWSEPNRAGKSPPRAVTFRYRQWRREAWLALVAMGALFLGATGVCLRMGRPG